MARMPSSRPTEKITGWPGALDGEWVQVVSYCGAGTRDRIKDALTHVDVDLSTGRAGTSTYTPGNYALEQRRLAVVDFCLFEEKEPGVKGAQIPFNEWTRDNMDPAIADYVDRKILELWGHWRAVIGQPAAKNGASPTPEEARQADATFSQGVALAAGGEASTEPAGDATA